MLGRIVMEQLPQTDLDDSVHQQRTRKGYIFPPKSMSNVKRNQIHKVLSELGKSDEMVEGLDNEKEENLKEVKRVLLLAYLRGGSTFLGKLFASNPDAFYWFEIIQPIYQSLYGIMRIPYEILYDKKGNKRDQTKPELEFIYEQLDKFYECKISELPMEMLYQETHNPDYSGIEWKEYHECIENETNHRIQYHLDSCVNYMPEGCRYNVASAAKRGCQVVKALVEGRHLEVNKSTIVLPLDNEAVNNITKYHSCLHKDIWVEAAQKCSRLASSSCIKAPVRAVKVLRLRLEDTEPLVQRYPDMKIIHQLRDPRGIIVSSQYLGLMSIFSQGNVGKEAILVCNKMLRDVKAFKRLKEKYPRNYFLTTYEEFADSPMSMVEEVYKFIDFEPSQSLRQHVYDITHSEFDTKRASLDVKRKNSSENAHKWRKQISSKWKTAIDKRCVELLTVAGYKL